MPVTADQTPTSAAEARATEASSLRRLAPWKKALLGGSMLFMVLGIVLKGVAMVSGPVQTPAGGTPDALVASGFAATENGDPVPAESEPGALDAWSPAIFRLGFSFFVGFSIAYATRAFLRLAIIVAGVLLILLFGLQYAGIIDVNWDAMGAHYERFAAWVSSQTATFTSFIRGYLPSAAMGGFGMVVGFRRG